MNIKSKNTLLSELELEFGKLGIDSITWLVQLGKHVVRLESAQKPIHGFGSTLVDALDDALTSYTQTLGSELMKAD